MDRRYPPMMVLLAATWGTPFLFLGYLVKEMPPWTIICARLLGSAPFLIAFLCSQLGVRRTLATIWEARRDGVVLGLTNAAIPFTFMAWGQKHVGASVAATASAACPLYVSLLAIRFRPSERTRGVRLVGLLVGIVGVAVLVGFRPQGGGMAIAGTVAALTGAFAYATSVLIGQGAVTRHSGPVLAACTSLYGGLALLPLALFQLPAHGLSGKASLSLLGIVLVPTVGGQVLFYWMVRHFGSARTSVTVYLTPPFAMLFGVTILGEHVGVSVLAALALILAGVSLATGLVRLPRPRRAGAVPELVP